MYTFILWWLAAGAIALVSMTVILCVTMVIIYDGDTLEEAVDNFLANDEICYHRFTKFDTVVGIVVAVIVWPVRLALLPYMLEEFHKECRRIKGIDKKEGS